MKLPELSIKNYQLVIMLVALGLFIGLKSLLTMPRNEDPNPQFPIYTVAAIYPGTSPEDMEELVVKPIEDAIDLVDDIEKVNSKIEEGIVVIRVEAKFGIDPDEKFDELETEINAVKDELPEGLYSLEVDKFKPNSRVNIQQIVIASENLPYPKLEDLAEQLEKKIERLKGIQEAKVEAVPEEQVRIALDFDRMTASHIPLEQVIGILQAQNLNIPGGDIKAGQRSFSIKTSGGYKDIEEIQNTVISTDGQSVVYLKNIADVYYDTEDIRWKATYKGEKCVYVSITQEDGTNLVKLGQAINQELDAFKSAVPGGVTVESIFEQAPAVSNRINDFFSNLLQGILLVGAIILLFLGGRSAFIIMMVIPLSIIMGIALLDLSGYALQQISIAALVIALGLLVDNAIVVVENIVRFQREGNEVKSASAKGTGEVGLAIVSSTLTTLLAFGPLAMMESGAGEFLRTLPLTVIFVLMVSLILALTVTPILASRILKNTANQSETERKKGLIERLMNRLIEKVYRPSLHFGLKRGWVIMLIAVVSFVGSFALFPSIGVSFFPTADKPMLLIEVETPRGSSIDRTEKAVEYVADILNATDFVKDYATNAGHGNPTVYYNRIGQSYKNYLGQVLVNFEEWNPEKFYQTLNELREKFEQYPDAKITFSELKNGPPFDAPIEIRIIGDDLDTLKAISFQLEALIKETEGTLNVDNPLAINKTDLKVNIHRAKSSMMGVSLATIDQSVLAALNGLPIGEMTDKKGEEYPIVVRLPFEEDTSIEDFNRISLTTPSGNRIPLAQLANLELEPSTTQILHYNLDRSTSVTADVYNPDATAAVTENIMARLDEIELPESYSFYVAGEYEGQQNSFGDLGTLLLIAMIGIFAVLVAQFRSFVQPLVVFSAVPLAITGSFVALFLTGWSFSFFAFVGFISLVGIAVNNSIILVDYTNQLRKSGYELKEAIVKAGETRFTPIILTTTTTILGLLPLTLSQTNLWSPLGWTIIGGMISSTFLTLLVVPILLNWFTRGKGVS